MVTNRQREENNKNRVPNQAELNAAIEASFLEFCRVYSDLGERMKQVAMQLARRNRVLHKNYELRITQDGEDRLQLQATMLDERTGEVVRNAKFFLELDGTTSSKLMMGVTSNKEASSLLHAIIAEDKRVRG